MDFKQAKYASVNTLGTLGYLSVIIQWTWCLITLGNPILTSENPFFLPQAPIPEIKTVIDFGIFTPYITLIALFVTVLLVILTVITLIRLPKTVGEKSGQATQIIAASLVARTHRHHPVSVKKRVKLSFWVSWLLKGVAIYIPLALVFVTPSIEGLSTQLITTVGFVCAIFSTGYFVSQLVLSLLLKLDPKKVW